MQQTFAHFGDEIVTVCHKSPAERLFELCEIPARLEGEHKIDPFTPVQGSAGGFSGLEPWRET